MKSILKFLVLPFFLAGLIMTVTANFIPGFENPVVSKLAMSIILGGFGIIAVSLAFAKTEKVWATNLLTFVGTIFGGLLLSIIICNWLTPGFNEASQNRRVNPELWDQALFQGRMMWLCISSFILATRISIKKRIGLD